MPFISFQDIYKRFEAKQVIQGLNLDIEKGERIAIIGPSGCGKSTLLRLLMGLQPIDRGNIQVAGHTINGMDEEALKNIRLKFGMLFQSGALFDSMTVEENVGFSLRENLKLPPDKVRRLVREKLDMVNMAGYGSHMPSDLSGGQKKRIGLARAIAAEPEIILYDEPTTGLDPVSSTIIENLIVDLAEKLQITSIVVTHQHSTIMRTADQIYMMHNGTLLAPETPATIMHSTDPNIRYFIRGGVDAS